MTRRCLIGRCRSPQRRCDRRLRSAQGCGAGLLLAARRRFSADESIGGSRGFHVEDYRKPEYRVQVTAAQKRVLEGATMPVTIDSRYFFGEPVANATVKYRVYHERHYWWAEDRMTILRLIQTNADAESGDSVRLCG